MGQTPEMLAWLWGTLCGFSNRPVTLVVVNGGRWHWGQVLPKHWFWAGTRLSPLPETWMFGFK